MVFSHLCPRDWTWTSMSYRSVWNYCLNHVFPTCVRWQGDGVLSLTGNNILHAHVGHNPLRQDQNADSIMDAVPPLPPLPSALIKLETSSAPDHHGASGTLCGARGQVQATSGSFLRTANTANQQCYWHSTRQLYIRSVSLKSAAAAPLGFHSTAHTCEIFLCTTRLV